MACDVNNCINNFPCYYFILFFFFFLHMYENVNVLQIISSLVSECSQL